MNQITRIDIKRQIAEVRNDISMLTEDPDNENAADLRVLRAKLAELRAKLK